MTDIKILVPQLQKQVEFLTEDLIVQATTVKKISVFLREHYAKSIQAGRSSQSYEEWLEEYLEQVAVSWVLSCVFVRFIEDNHLINECYLAGEGDRGKIADGGYELFFRQHPHTTDREYLKYVFGEIEKLPTTKELFQKGKATLWAVDPSGDAARRLLQFFKQIDPEAGGLRWTYETISSRAGELVIVYQCVSAHTQFLGDLYQDLSQHARKKYALLQTPDFVQQFILDRTLTPAIAQFGVKNRNRSRHLQK